MVMSGAGWAQHNLQFRNEDRRILWSNRQQSDASLRESGRSECVPLDQVKKTNNNQQQGYLRDDWIDEDHPGSSYDPLAPLPSSLDKLGRDLG